MSESLRDRHHREFGDLLKKHEAEENGLKDKFASFFACLFGAVLGVVLVGILRDLFPAEKAKWIFVVTLICLGVWRIYKFEQDKTRMSAKHSRQKEELLESHVLERKSATSASDEQKEIR